MVSQYIYHKGLISYLKYNILKNYSDRIEKDKKYQDMAFTCMGTESILFIKQKVYKLAFLRRLLPENCNLKNNVIVASF